jgi:hypothetical protein
MRFLSGLKLRGTWVAAACWLALAMGGCATEELEAAQPGDGTVRQEVLAAPPFDTLCGDGVCSGAETQANCPEDCTAAAVCGDGVCNGGETPASCPTDCPVSPVCGDGVCNPGETAASCPVDCVPAVCGDCVCSYGEAAICPWDCNVPGYPTWCIEQ